MKSKILFLAFLAGYPCLGALATDEDESKEKDIDVRLTTYTVSDEALNATRSIDGDTPVQPLNLIIGPSKLTLFGYAQTAYTYSETAGEKTNAFDVTRIILMANAELTQKLSFFMMYDAVKSQLHEYYAQYAFNDALKLRVGQFKQPFSLENLQSPTSLSNVAFDASVLYMSGIATDPCIGNHVARDAGVMITGEAVPFRGWKLLNYSLGVFNGTGMNVKENNNQKDLIGMLNVTPLKGVMFSTSFILGTGHAEADNIYGAFKAGDNYTRNRWAAGIEAKTKPVYIRGEYLIGNDGGIHSKGYYADAEFHVAKKFDIVADYDYLKKNNKVSDSAQQNYLIGAQYWLYKRCRVLSQFVYKNPKTEPSTKMWITQFQVVF